MLNTAARTALAFVVFLFGIAGFAAAQPPTDAENCKDHPMFSRMKNYTIVNCERNFDAAEFAIPGGTKTVEGQKTEIAYALNEDSLMPSLLQIRRNYGAAAKSLGGTLIYDEEGQLTARVSKGGKDVWLGVEVYNGGRSYTLTVIEVGAMTQEVTASDMLDALNKDGFIALHINFATGKADIAPASMPLVDEIARLLKDNADLKVAFEGHTDNVGAAAANKTLSEQRAGAVMAAVVKSGIGPARLSAAGFGQEKPVADNRTEEGRARNRRVEVVKK